MQEAQMQETHPGGCLCGAIRFELQGRLHGITICHCGMCRRWHGHVGAYTAVPREALVWRSEARPAWYASSDFARRGFCGACGSSLFWENPAEAHVAVAAGALDAPTGLTTKAHIYLDDRGDYYRL